MKRTVTIWRPRVQNTVRSSLVCVVSCTGTKKMIVWKSRECGGGVLSDYSHGCDRGKSYDCLCRKKLCEKVPALLRYFLINYDLGRSTTHLKFNMTGFELMTSRSWQYISCHWDVQRHFPSPSLPHKTAICMKCTESLGQNSTHLYDTYRIVH